MIQVMMLIMLVMMTDSFKHHQLKTFTAHIKTIQIPDHTNAYQLMTPKVLGLAKCAHSFQLLLHQSHGLRLLRHPHAGPQQGVILSKQERCGSRGIITRLGQLSFVPLWTMFKASLRLSHP